MMDRIAELKWVLKTKFALLQRIGGDIEWDKTTQGWVLSSFFYGYIVTQIPGGYLSGRFGGKRVMLVGMLVYALVTLLTPVAARWAHTTWSLRFQAFSCLAIALVSSLLLASSLHEKCQGMTGILFDLELAHIPLPLFLSPLWFTAFIMNNIVLKIILNGKINSVSV